MNEWGKWVNKIHCGDVLGILRQMPDEFVDCIITSPPYWGLRDYGVEEQIGLEPTLEEYLKKLLAVTAELKRVLKPTGVCFWNHASNYKNKCDMLQNYRLILRMIDEQGWILRNIIIWHKPNHMPSSAKDRFTNAYEPVFMLVKSQKYWFDLDAVRIPHRTNVSGLPGHLDRKEEIDNWRSCPSGPRNLHPAGRNPGDVWTVPTQPFPEAHFATFPERLVEPMIKAGCPPNGVVLDPFMGSGTVAKVATRLRRQWIGIELNPEYVEIAYRRLNGTQLEMFT